MSPKTKFVDERSKEVKVDSETETSDSDVKTETLKIHYLPLKIQFNGKADVEKMFSASIQMDEDRKVLKNEFRGRPLTGSKLELPSGYKGIIVDTNSSSLLPNSRSSSSSSGNGNSEGNEVLYVKKEFNGLTYWNWDRVPSGMDKPVKVMDWLHLANELHSPEPLDN